jgi:hypothetical protein
MAVEACASNRVEPSAAMMPAMSAAKMHMAKTMAAAAMTSSMSAATMTSAMSAAAAVTSAAAPGYRVARERHREDNERNSN